MPYRRLGKTGLKVSVVGVGTWQFGGEWGKEFMQHPAVTCVIPGCKMVGQVEANASAASLDLVRDDHP